MYLAIRHFRHFMEGRVFHVQTDHKPLTFALTSRSDNHTPRQVRHLHFIAQFTSDVRFIKGTNNEVADALSRVSIAVVHALDTPSQVLDFEEMAAAQLDDPDCQSPSSSVSVRAVPLPLSDTTMLCDFSTGTQRPLVPQPFRRRVFEKLHSLSHPGI